MIASAEGGAGLLHKITKPTDWGGVRVLEEVGDAKPMKRHVTRNGESGRGTGSATRRCKTWRTTRGGIRSLEEEHSEQSSQELKGRYWRGLRPRLVKRNESRNCEVPREG